MASAGNSAKAEEKPTILSKTVAPVLLAFLSGWYDVVCFTQYKSYALMPTGNFANLWMQLGNGNTSNFKFLTTSVACYTGGMGLYKFLDLTLQGLSCTTAAHIVFALHTVSDQLRLAAPNNRFTVLPLSISGGFFNALSVGKLGGIMTMMSGHFQGLSGAIAQCAAKGDDQKAVILKHVRILVAFSLGVFMSAKVGKMDHPFAQIANRRFTFIGALYAAILVLHETTK